MNEVQNSTVGIPLVLKWKVAGFTALATFTMVLAAFLLIEEVGVLPAGGWLIVSITGLIVLFGTVWLQLSKNHIPGEEDIVPVLGAGTSLSILRGILLAAVAGFLALPDLMGRLNWWPGLLFGIAVVSDFFDGYLARRQGLETRLGEWLDINLDSAGVLIGCLVGIHFARLPIWYLPVGLARYLFIVGIWLRIRRGLPVYTLRESSRRRGLAGAQMIFISVLLLPVFSPPATYYAAAIFMIVFLGGFIYDWFLVSGRVGGGEAGWLHTKVLPLSGKLSLLLRLLTSGLLIYSAISSLFRPIILERAFLAVLVEIVLAFMLLFGFAGRLAALLVLVLVGFEQMSGPLDLTQILLIFCASLVFFIGTGARSVWSPEGRLAGYRAGRRRSKS